MNNNSIDAFSLVKQLHEKFKLGVNRKPTVPSEEEMQHRYDLIEEECQELLEALKLGDLAKIAREAIDTISSILGTMVLYGLPYGALFTAVWQANMAKVRNPDPAAKKLIKPKGWQSPDDNIKRILATEPTFVGQMRTRADVEAEKRKLEDAKLLVAAEEPLDEVAEAELEEPALEPVAPLTTVGNVGLNAPAEAETGRPGTVAGHAGATATTTGPKQPNLPKQQAKKVNSPEELIPADLKDGPRDLSKLDKMQAELRKKQ